MILLKELQLNNYLSHEKTILKFNDNEKILLDGKSGAGKSSIVEAIIWVLYGKGRSESNRGLIKTGNNSARVILFLENNGVFYRIERSVVKTGKNTLKVSIGSDRKNLKPVEVTGVKATQEYLEKKILHSSYSLFVNSIAYPQDNSNNFVKQTASKRKEILLDMVNASVYDEYYIKAKDELSIFKTDQSGILGIISVIKDSIIEDEKYLSENANLKTEVKTLIEELNLVDDKYTEENNKLLLLNSTVDKIDQSKNELDVVKNSLSKVRKEINTLNVEYIKINSFNVKEESKKFIDLDKYKEKLAKHNSDMELMNNWNTKKMMLLSEKPIYKDFDNDITEINRQIISIISRKVEVCPKLNIICPLISEENGRRVEELETRLRGIDDDKNTYIKRLGAYTEKENELESIKPTIEDVDSQDLTSKISDLENIKSEIEKKEVDKKNILESINSLLSEKTLRKEELIKKETELSDFVLNNSVENISELRSSVSLLFDKKNTMEKSMIEGKSKVAVMESTEERVKMNKETLKKEKIKKDLVEKNIERMELLKEAFGSNGIKSIVVDYVIPKLEDRINEILKLLSNFTIQLDTQRSGVKEDVVKEGLFINIFDENGVSYDFENYSGGERLKIIVSISEALSELQSIGFRILDELFIGLDEDSTEKFADVMEVLHERFGQMLCISHLRNIKDLFDNKIVVSNINGSSTIKS